MTASNDKAWSHFQTLMNAPPFGNELETARNYLQMTSALEFPPASAGICGLGSRAYRLYNCIVFYILYVVELGIIRTITDDCHEAFGTLHQYNPIPKTQLIRIANQRMLDVPDSARLGRVLRFRINENEKQTGMSGRIRRISLPFYWYAVMGLALDSVPDQDPVL
ncbi:hypothetical protein FGB62_57g06 [Gracilaria domingensis]|nr:hypothetical protein FGB62_57g06 [Gracilaria domingensis]